MDGFNFFSWIRDGVRQSVLLGVSDAVGQLGTPPAEEELHPIVTSLIGEKANGSSATPRISNAPPKHQAGRRRLGKSLKDIGSESA